MSISEEIKGFVEEQLEADEFLVEVVLKGAPGTQKLIVLVDSDKGVTIEKCAAISRQLSSYLEEHDLFDSAYTLEVSSPGLDHPLKLKRQYEKNIGRNIRIERVDGSQVEGMLVSQNDDTVVLKKTEKKIEETLEVSFADINKAMVLVSFSK